MNTIYHLLIEPREVRHFKIFLRLLQILETGLYELTIFWSELGLPKQLWVNYYFGVLT